MTTTKQYAAIMAAIHPRRPLRQRDRLFVIDQCRLIALAIEGGASQKCVHIMCRMVRARFK